MAVKSIRKDKALSLKAYEDMLLIRRFEEKAGQLYGMGLIGGFCHLYIGQEAVAVGVQHSIRKEDAVITSYRDHGQMLATGSDPRTVMAELLGRATGCSKGKGGSMHMFDVNNNFWGGHGIVGAQVSLGTGMAFAQKYRETDNISVVYFGDGAVNQGQVYESFNMAKLWNLPVLYIVENNHYAMGTSVGRSTSVMDLYKRGESFGIPGFAIDGMDFYTVYEEVSKHVASIRKGSGPILLEMKTYRYRGHSMSDPGKYRSKDEVNEYKEKFDPIDRMAAALKKAGFADDSLLESIEAKINKQVRDAADFAQNSPEPSEDELYTDIYAN